MLWAALGCVRIPFIALVNKDHASRKLFEAKSQYDQFIYNRIFVSRTAEWGEMEEGILDMSTYYYEANPASVLLDNINAARQTWNYG